MKRDSRIFVLTGAGISAESGISVFQGTSWHGHSHYELANIAAWERDPELVWRYYSDRRGRGAGAKPNAAHFALAEFERSRHSSTFFLCTQNVDGLHEAAGSKQLVHIHGKLFESRCADGCGRPAAADANIYSDGVLPRCQCGALLRPNVCWFGEQPYGLDRVSAELENCDVFIAIGTSGSVQPVASFVAMLKSRTNPATTVFIGLAQPENAQHFDQVYLGPATEVVPRVLQAGKF